MNKMPINPVTIRGCIPKTKDFPQFAEETNPSNLSIGRLWIGTDKVDDGSHRFNPSQPQQQWKKPVIFVLWGVNMEEAKTMVSSDEHFIALVKKIQTKDDISITLWGNETVSEDSKVCALVFNRTNKDLTVLQIDEDGAVFGGAFFSFDKFIEGLGHLFPKGELQ